MPRPFNVLDRTRHPAVSGYADDIHGNAGVVRLHLPLGGLGVQSWTSSDRKCNKRHCTWIYKGTAMSSTGTKDMRRIFAEWPVSIPRTGLIVTTFGEQIQFVSYMFITSRSVSFVVVHSRLPQPEALAKDCV